MRPKRLISLLVAVCMMITMLPLSAVTAFATDTSTVHDIPKKLSLFQPKQKSAAPAKRLVQRSEPL